MGKRSSKLKISEKRLLVAFGDRVRKIRVKNKLDIYDVTGEDMLIRTRQHWQKIENGQKNINLTTVVKIAQTLEIDITDLFANLDF